MQSAAGRGRPPPRRAGPVRPLLATTSTFASGQLAQGDTFSFTFEEPGTYYYECTVHATMATMHAVVIVE